MRTDELIVALARSAEPVDPLDKPSVRLARWLMVVLPLTALAVIVIGPRRDVLNALAQPGFFAIAMTTLATAILSAACALVLGVPGAERSVWQRLLPFLVAGVWALALLALLTIGGDAARRLAAWPFHWACFLEIVGLGVAPAWMLFAMVRRAAPLRRAWSGALVVLAAVAVSAVAAQLICPIDDPAHQLVGHLAPVMAASISGALAGRRWLDWEQGAGAMRT